jgi:phospholipid/cholesterol/gamma-HCH transport system substrate-binding protein
MKSLMLKLFGGPMVHGHRTVSSVKIGVAFIIVVLVGGWVMFNKTKVVATLTPGDTIQVHFAREYRLFPYVSKVKVSYVPVGVVTDSEELDDRTSMIDIKIDKGVKERLGSAPVAVIRPTTLLGGNYFLDLIPGGDKGAFTGDLIPTERTRLPVELDAITRALQPNALAGLQGTVRKLDETLAGGGRAALQRLVADAPGSLEPTSEVVQALRGTNPERDLANVVDGLENTARELSQPPGRTEAIIKDLAATSAAFGRRSPEFAATLGRLPSALRETDAGLKRLNTTLDILEDTAADIRPTAQELEPTLDRLDPVLERARPVIAELRDVVEDLRPVVEDLRPVSTDLTEVFDDLDGPVVDRVNGPIRDMLYSPFKGTGRYINTQTDKPIFQEVVYALNNLDRANMVDNNASAISFQPGPIPEPFENVIQNDGRPRVESLLQSGASPLKPNPPVQVPPSGQGPSDSGPGDLPLLGDISSSGKAGR